MITRLKHKKELAPFFTRDLLENGYGVIIDNAMPKDSFLAVDIDEYYHHIGLTIIPSIADILLVAQRLSQSNQFHIYIVEMKNIKSPHGFNTKNIHEKFHTAIEDFMKAKYADVFMDLNIEVARFRLFFITDAYRLKKRGLSEYQIRSFLTDTKIALLQSMPVFNYRNFHAMIEYKLPNPLLSWR